MTRDRPLWELVVAAAATYPAVGLGWCVATLLGTEPEARELGLAGHPAALAALALAATGAVAMARSLGAMTAGLRHTRQFHRWVTSHRVPPAGQLAAVTTELGLSGRVRVVAAGEVAVTAGLLRPYVVVSAGLADLLCGAELRAVLAHERVHLYRRDPLRVLLARTLVAHLWFAPVAGDLRRRAECGYELAADRDAAARYGRRAVAGALLRVGSPAGPRAGDPGGALARFADRETLESRISQLESGRPPHPVPIPPGRTALTMVAALAFLAATAGGWAFMLLTCPHACPYGMI